MRVGLFFALFFNVKNIKMFIDHGEGAKWKGGNTEKVEYNNPKIKALGLCICYSSLARLPSIYLPGHLLLVLWVLTERPGSPLCVSIATKAHPIMGFASLFKGLVNLSDFFIKDKV